METDNAALRARVRELEEELRRVQRLPELDWAKVTSQVFGILAKIARDGGRDHALEAQAAMEAGQVYVTRIRARTESLEAERDALREALTEIVCISGYEMYDECAHSIPLEDCHKLAKDALAATEVKP